MDWKIGLAVLLAAVLLKGCIGAESGPMQGESKVPEEPKAAPPADDIGNGIGDLGDLDDAPPPPPPE